VATVLAVAAMLVAATPASGAVAHVVQPGESLWSISAANNLTTRTVAVFNGLDENAVLTAGQTIQVPTVDEGAAALANAGIAPGSSTATASSASGGADHVVQPGESLWSISAANGVTVSTLASFNGLSDDALLIAGETIQVPAATSSSTSATPLGNIWCPCGTLHLIPAAADSFNAMRQASLDQFGIDLYPAGPLSAYRTYDQQAYLYDLFLSGQGAPANPPGTSEHNLGIAVDLADPAMRNVVDQIGAGYGWAGTAPTEWWHVAYLG
jgi:LysM repeat protein